MRAQAPGACEWLPLQACLSRAVSTQTGIYSKRAICVNRPFYFMQYLPFYF